MKHGIRPLESLHSSASGETGREEERQIGGLAANSAVEAARVMRDERGGTWSRETKRKRGKIEQRRRPKGSRGRGCGRAENASRQRGKLEESRASQRRRHRQLRYCLAMQRPCGERNQPERQAWATQRDPAHSMPLSVAPAMMVQLREGEREAGSVLDVRARAKGGPTRLTLLPAARRCRRTGQRRSLRSWRARCRCRRTRSRRRPGCCTASDPRGRRRGAS